MLRRLQDLLVESVQHEAHSGHLADVARKLTESVTCSALESQVQQQHQAATILRLQVSSLLYRLEELHVHWPAYTVQMDQLQEWCEQAHQALAVLTFNPDMDQADISEKFNQIWVSVEVRDFYTFKMWVTYFTVKVLVTLKYSYFCKIVLKALLCLLS